MIILKSKRNRVFLDQEKNIVYKTFFDHLDYLQEVDLYLRLGDEICHPQLLAYHNDSITLANIHAPTLVEELERQEKEGIRINVWFQLFDLLKKCKDLCGLLPTDPNLSNFLYDQNQIYFIDFEQYDTIDLHTCYERMIAFMMLYDPIQSKTKLEIANYLVNLYHLNQEKISREIKQILNRRMK